MVRKIILILLLIPLFSYSQKISILGVIKDQQTGAFPTPEPPPYAGGDFVLGELKAFPSADGFGKYVSGGRGGTIIEVTNNNVTGTGSLREALSAAGAKIIVGTTGVRIDASASGTKTYLSQDNVSLLGQTFEGSGLMHYGQEFEINGENNWVIRHVDFLGGDPIIGSGDDAMRILARFAQNETLDGGILDHCTIFWGDDETLSMNADDGKEVRNVTIQNSIIAESFRNGKGFLIFRNTYNISVLNNLSTNHWERSMIRVSGGTDSFEVVNNVSHYSKQPPAQFTWGNVFDYVGNVDYRGSESLYTSRQITFSDAPQNGTWDVSQTRGYIEGNYLDGVSQNVVNGSTWNDGLYRENSKILNSGSRIIDDTATNIRDYVLANVGSNRNTSALEQRQINDALGITTGSFKLMESQTVGKGTHLNGTAKTDTDGDYIPDSWESAMGLDPNSSADAIVKPTSFTIDGITYDNREYTGGTYNGFIYVGGTLTGSNLYDWREIYWEDLANGFQTMHY
jgi:hypothetical protein